MSRISRRRQLSERHAFWIPLLYAAAALVTGLALPRLERGLLPDLTVGIDPAAALAILTGIASGMMGLTAIVFSVAFVMVQFSATAYSPRLVLWLARSAVINHSIGLFTATFVYSLAAAAWINRDGSGLIPPITVWFAVSLLLASLALFVLLVERVGMLQVTRVLAFAGDEGRRVIERMYHAPTGSGHAPASAGTARAAVETAGLPLIQTIAHRGGYGLVQFKGALQLPDGTESSAKYRGMALPYGAGWLFHQNRRFAWGPYGSHDVSTLGSATIDSFQAVNIISNAWVAGIGFVFN